MGDDLNVDKAIEATEIFLTDLFNFQNISFAIQGPIKITGLDFLERITEDFHFLIDSYGASDFLNRPIVKKNSQDLSDLSSLIGKSTIDIKLEDSGLSVDYKLRLPFLNFIIPPQENLTRYEGSFDFYSNDYEVAKFDFDPLQLLGKKETFEISSSFTVRFNNTLESANALGNTINPILSNSPGV